MVGELRCLNCSRHLADVVDGERGQPRLSPPAGQDAAPILFERGGRGLRCARCGGRAILERTLDLGRSPQPAANPGQLSPAA